MKVGYARVSTEDQRLDLQRDALLREGCGRVFEEKRSGASPRRPVLQSTLHGLRPGDVLVVWRLDRLGRSLQDLISIVGTLERRQVGFRSISDNVDTTTSGGKLLFHVMGAIAEFERALISERTKAGMEAARVKGRKPGRPRRLSPVEVFHVKCLSVVKEMSVAAIAEEMKVGQTTVRRALRQ